MEGYIMIGAAINRMILYFGPDAGRIQHAMKVYCLAYALWDEEARTRGIPDTDERRNSLLLTAVLHDIGIHEAERKYNSSAGKYQEIEGPPIAEKILRECGADAEITARVSYLVAHHHTYNLIDGLDFQILVEADLLVNLEEEKGGREAVLFVRDKYMTTSGAKLLMDSYLSFVV